MRRALHLPISEFERAKAVTKRVLRVAMVKVWLPGCTKVCLSRCTLCSPHLCYAGSRLNARPSLCSLLPGPSRQPTSKSSRNLTGNLSRSKESLRQRTMEVCIIRRGKFSGFSADVVSVHCILLFVCCSYIYGVASGLRKGSPSLTARNGK